MCRAGRRPCLPVGLVWPVRLSAIARGPCRIFYEFRKFRKSRVSEFLEFIEYAGFVYRMHVQITRIPKIPKLGQFWNFRNVGAGGSPPHSSKYVFQISDVRGPLPLPKMPLQRSGLRTPACPSVPPRALIVWMALMASGIEVPQPRWSHLLSAILSAVMSLLCCWPAVGRIGLECCRSSKA